MENKHFLIMKICILVDKFPETISTLGGIDLYTADNAALDAMYNTIFNQSKNIIKQQAK